VKVITEHSATHDALASMHQVHVAFQRVYLAVVCYEPMHHSCAIADHITEQNLLTSDVAVYAVMLSLPMNMHNGR